MKKTFASLLFAFISNCVVREIVAQNSGNCELEGVTTSDWNTAFTNYAVDDTERNLFRSFPVQNVNNVSVSGNSATYVTASITDNILSITPSSAFENYERNEPSTTSPPELVVTLSFRCQTGTSELLFRQPITDINNHEPTFSSSSYIYSLPMPFPSNIPISGIFGDAITATDIDITNTRLDFFIYPEGDFTISYSSSDTTNKVHTAVLRSASALRINSTTTYILTVTDRGTLPGPLSTNATLTIAVDIENSVDQSPAFTSSYYTATYTKASDNTSIDYITLASTITLADNNYENTTFNIEGDYSGYFTFERATNQLNFRLSTNLPTGVLTNNSYIVVPISAFRSNAEYSGTTVVIIDLTGGVAKISSPKFTSPYYTAEYVVNNGANDIIDLRSLLTLSDNDYDSTTFAIEGEYSANFRLTTSSSGIEVTLNNDLENDLLYNNNFILLPLRASRSGAEVDGYTILAITLPGEECTQTTTTTIGEEPTTVCPTVTTVTVTECPETATATVCPTESSVSCPPCTEFTTVTEIDSPSTGSTATTFISSTFSTVSECPPECITTLCPTESTITTTACKPCDEVTTVTQDAGTATTQATNPTTITTESPSALIQFERAFYAFSLEPLHVIGTIGTVSASSSLAEAVTYTISASSGSSLPPQISIDSTTGNIIASNYITSGSYNLVARATGAISGSTGTTIVYIHVGSVQICSDDVRTAYSVVSKHITEEQLNYDILTFDESVSLDNYTYAIVEQFPSTNPFLFEINSTTGSLQTKAIIDREWEGISDSYVSQLTLRIRLIRTGETFEPTLRDNTTSFYSYDRIPHRSVYDENERAWVNIEERLYNIANETVVSVVVDDINDNAPEFSAGSSLLLGYPHTALLGEIAPTSLTTVKATDKDIGENAIIRYSSSSDAFLVHQSTGVVYVATNIFTNGNEVDFTVTATDRDGSRDGLSTTLQIKVKELRDDHLTVLLISNATLENVENLLNSISTTSGYVVRGLTSSVIPSGNQLPRARVISSEHRLRIIVYAFDSNNQLIDSEVLQRAIASSPDSQTISWSAFSRSQPSQTSTTVYLVSIILLSILLALLLVAAAAFYFIYFKRRPETYEKMKEEFTPPMYVKNERLSNTTSAKSDLANRRPTAYNSNIGIENNESIPEGNNEYSAVYTNSQNAISERRSTGFVFSKTPFDLDNQSIDESSTDDILSPEKVVDKVEVSSSSPNPPPPPPPLPGTERRKSVTFNTNVEKIEIEKDDDEDDEDDDEYGEIQSARL